MVENIQPISTVDVFLLHSRTADVYWNYYVDVSLVLGKRGYDGAPADIWSCGVILYVLLTGYLPFEDSNLPTLYKKVSAAEFSYPFWIPFGAKSLIDKILDPNPETMSICFELSSCK